MMIVNCFVSIIFVLFLCLIFQKCLSLSHDYYKNVKGLLESFSNISQGQRLAFNGIVAYLSFNFEDICEPDPTRLYTRTLTFLDERKSYEEVVYYFPPSSVAKIGNDRIFIDQEVFQFVLSVPRGRIDFNCLSQFTFFTTPVVDLEVGLESEESVLLQSIVCTAYRAMILGTDLEILLPNIRNQEEDDKRCVSQNALSDYFIPNRALDPLIAEIFKICGSSDLDNLRDKFQATNTVLTTKESSRTSLNSIELSEWLYSYQEEKSAHFNQSCRLWWPLNHTELFFYSPAVLASFHPEPYKSQQLMLFQCDLPEGFDAARFNRPNTDFVFDIIYKDYYDLHCSDCYVWYSQKMNFIDYLQRDFLKEGYQSMSPIRAILPMIFGESYYFRQKDTSQSIPHDRLTKHIEVEFFLREIYHDIDSISEEEVVREQSTPFGKFLIDQHITFLIDISTQDQSKMNHETENNLDKYLSKGYTTIRKLEKWLAMTPTREDFGYLFSALYPNGFSFVEIGVYQGQYAERMVRTSNTMKLYVGIDVWKPMSMEDYFDGSNVQTTQFHDNNFLETLHRISYDRNRSFYSNDGHYSPLKMLIREDASKAAHLFSNHSIDIVYIDAMHHYTAVVKDILTWYPKVKVGGIIAGHDFMFTLFQNTIFTVKPAVEKFARDNNLILFRTDEDVPTWMIVKTHDL